MIEYRYLKQGNIQDFNDGWVLARAQDVSFESVRANVINILKCGIVLNYKFSVPASQKTQIFFIGMTSRLTAFSEASSIYSEDYTMSGFSNVTAGNIYRNRFDKWNITVLKHIFFSTTCLFYCYDEHSIYHGLWRQMEA